MYWVVTSLGTARHVSQLGCQFAPCVAQTSPTAKPMHIQYHPNNEGLTAWSSFVSAALSERLHMSSRSSVGYTNHQLTCHQATCTRGSTCTLERSASLALFLQSSPQLRPDNGSHVGESLGGSQFSSYWHWREGRSVGSRAGFQLLGSPKVLIGSGLEQACVCVSSLYMYSCLPSPSRPARSQIVGQ